MTLWSSRARASLPPSSGANSRSLPPSKSTMAKGKSANPADAYRECLLNSLLPYI